MSVLIVGNVVSGAVVAGYRRIGVLKSIGFSPGQVVAAYVIQVPVPALGGCLAGVLLGNVLSVPLLGQTAQVYGVGTLAVPAWVDLVVPLAMGAWSAWARCCRRCGRAGSAQCRPSRPGAPREPAAGTARTGCSARPLPRPVTIGLAGPFARPARTVITLAAILFGGIAVTFAAGLGASLTRVDNDLISRGPSRCR